MAIEEINASANPKSRKIETAEVILPVQKVEKVKIEKIEKPKIEKIERPKIEFRKNRASEEIATRALNKSLPPQLSSSISFDKSINMMVVNITEKKTGEVIKTIPSESMINIIRNRGKIGNLINTKA
jgi:uncharacterized FlaG/YvyC family protein